jgi:GntR family transcriptional regulator/MocR family aminotransferase
VKRPEVFLPAVELDAASDIPMHRQIARQIGAAIRAGAIPGGVRLPSSRAFARLLRVSRNTVLAAYDDIAADGLILGERGAGMRVSSGKPARSSLRQVIRDSGYAEKAVVVADPDGNSLYLHE